MAGQETEASTPSGTDPWAEAEAAARRAASRGGDVNESEVDDRPEPGTGDDGAGPEAQPAEQAAQSQAPEAAEAERAGAGPVELDAADVTADAAEVSAADTEEGAAEDEVSVEEDPEAEEAFVRSVGALLFASPEPMGVARLQSLLEESSAGRVRRALALLAERLETAGVGLLAREIGGGWRLLSDPELAPVVGRLFQTRKTERISQAGLETLAIIAYRQPVTKAEIEAIRGVQAGPVLRSLVDRALVRVTGRADQPGSPLLYGTTRTFLDRFGLGRVEDLPRDAELARE